MSAPRGSGGCLTHLGNVIPRLQRIRPDWDIELHASTPVLERVFGTTQEHWMHEIGDDGYAARLEWEFVKLPGILRSIPPLSFMPHLVLCSTLRAPIAPSSCREMWSP